MDVPDTFDVFKKSDVKLENFTNEIESIFKGFDRVINEKLMSKQTSQEEIDHYQSHEEQLLKKRVANIQESFGKILDKLKKLLDSEDSSSAEEAFVLIKLIIKNDLNSLRELLSIDSTNLPIVGYSSLLSDKLLGIDDRLTKYIQDKIDPNYSHV